MYKMNVTCNTADTWRDPDNIVHICEKYYKSKQDVVKGVKDYIHEHFFDTELANKVTLENVENFSVWDPRSYGHTIEVTKIHVEV